MIAIDLYPKRFCLALKIRRRLVKADQILKVQLLSSCYYVENMKKSFVIAENSGHFCLAQYKRQHLWTEGLIKRDTCDAQKCAREVCDDPLFSVD